MGSDLSTPEAFEESEARLAVPTAKAARMLGIGKTLLYEQIASGRLREPSGAAVSPSCRTYRALDVTDGAVPSFCQTTRANSFLLPSIFFIAHLNSKHRLTSVDFLRHAARVSPPKQATF